LYPHQPGWRDPIGIFDAARSKKTALFQRIGD
jgi:hypothetical protein